MDQLVDLLPSFHSVRHLQYVNFMPQTINATNEATDSVCENHIRMIAAMYVSSVGLLLIQFSMVGSYIKDLENPLKCQNQGVGACASMGASLPLLLFSDILQPQ